MTTPSRPRFGRFSGFGFSDSAVSRVFRPQSLEEVSAAIEAARLANRKVVLRGAGRSYGDAAILSEEILLDLTALNACSLHAGTGVVQAQCGATIADVWRAGLPKGWWPPVVSGTMFPTLGGAVAMNIHGKNAWKSGPIGEHVRSLRLLGSDGNVRTLTPADEAFYAVVSGAGLLGVILEVELQLKPVASGDVDVVPVRCSDWGELFAQFDQYRDDADYMVGWVDAFAGGPASGRSVFHAAWHRKQNESETLTLAHQQLPSRVFGFVPKTQLWRALRMLNRRAGVRALNAAKFRATPRQGKPHRQSLAAFNFLLDSIPDWERSYSPGGFLQYQCFVPEAGALELFRKLFEMQQTAGLENYLSVVKRHRKDRFLFSHGVEGYSLAQDFPLGVRRQETIDLCHRMNDEVLAAGGRFYFAKDSTLRPADVESFLGKEAIAAYRRWKAELDPAGLFDSALARRLNL